MRVPVGVVRGSLREPDDDEPAVGRAQHFDRRPVESSQRLVRDHLLWKAGEDAAAGDVDDAVEVRQQRRLTRELKLLDLTC